MPETRTSRRRPTWVRATGWMVAALAFALAVWIARRGAQPELPRTVAVYAFSAMEGVLRDAVFPGFERTWREQGGERLEIVATFAGSGAITRRILDELPVDVAVLSSEIDALRLRRHGIVSGRPWERLPHRGIVSRSPIVIFVRAGNPAGIGGFPDLLREGVGLVRCDPLTSGAGEWSLVAIHAALRERAPGIAPPGALGGRIAATAESARGAIEAFRRGTGDALVTYESEWHALPPERRAGIEIVRPPATVLSEHVVVKIDRHVDPDERAVVDALVAYLWSVEAQAMFEAHGFLGAAGEAEGRTLDDLGGPERVEREVLAPWLAGRDGERD